MQDTIFTKIIRGNIPAYKVYETEHALAILDINPVRAGHVLVISKRPVDQLIDLPTVEYQAMWQTVQTLALHMRATLGVPRVAIKVIGTDVPHAHIHLIPFDSRHEPTHDSSSPVVDARYFDDLVTRLRIETA
jgi:histidine triad (HIT) family protein